MCRQRSMPISLNTAWLEKGAMQGQTRIGQLYVLFILCRDEEDTPYWYIAGGASITPRLENCA